ncbi:MarR family transcriptional regulator [Streptomyces sp. NPDC091287]|uniref:MarR family transcriptional regulator n=1 Tax=Streptomyces sp. NPDC091287 TaxID=3365988 RepID=UPI0038195D70
MGSPIGNTTDQAPANPAATDDMLATQPIGYWSGLAHATVTRHLRDAMARIDVTQPQYWVLNSVNGGGPAAPSREEVVDRLTHLADGPHEIARVVDQLLHRAWLNLELHDARVGLVYGAPARQGPRGSTGRESSTVSAGRWMRGADYLGGN